jgi:hypothetical protein
MSSNKTLFKVDRNLVKITVQFENELDMRNLYEYIIGNNVAPSVNGNSAGNFKFEGFFNEDNAEKIITFLKQNGAKNSQIIQS